MKLKINVLLFLFVSITSTAFCANDTLKLHKFYEQNGECFVLVGNGANRAVWALNNLSDTKKPEKLYDPEDAYGITAGQKYIAANDSIEKRLYTFAGKDTGLTDITGQVRGRAIIPVASYNVWTGNSVPTATVHRYHTSPDSGPSKLGNHTMNYVNGLFAGRDYPCNVWPLVSSGKTDDFGRTLYNYKVGDGYYHSFDYEVYSPYTYRSYGGYAHRMVREHIKEAIRDLKLYTFKIGSSPFENIKDVARVTTKVEGTMDLNGECCDGCIRRQSNVAMPGVPSPVLASAYSAQVNRSYLYNRPAGKTDYTLLGEDADDERKGKGDDTTCNYIGISSKSKTGNYIYLLGQRLINQWMDEYSCPASMKIQSPDDLSGVACSDQWWQTGGLIYAYDKTKGKVYSFVRVEVPIYDENGNEIQSDPPSEIDVAFDGVKPDKIGCDGFGNLYMLKTEYDPPSTNEFNKEGSESKTEDTGETYGPTGQRIFMAYFEQGVYKTVYKKPYGSNNIEKVKNRILLGQNVFTKTYVTEDNKIDSEKTWLDKTLLQIEYADDPVRIRTELAVINSPTPPRPDHVDAVTDCVGPTILVDKVGFQMATPNSDGLYTSDNDLFFIVENAPQFDANGINIGNNDEDMDGDGRIGRFPNTIKKSSVKYFWKIRRTHDREGNPVDKYDEENQILNSEGDYVLYFPSLLEGKFEVGVKVTYGYYDYSQLPVGSLASDKESVYVSGQVARGETAPAGHPEDAGYPWQKIGQKIVDAVLSSKDRGVLMTGPNAAELVKSSNNKEESRTFTKSKFKPGPGNEGYGCSSSCSSHPQCRTDNQTPDITYFVMDGYSLCDRKITGYKEDGKPIFKYNDDSIKWGMLLRDTSYNIKNGINRVASMTSIEPPNPNDPSLIKGTLKWLDTDENGRNKLTVEWKADLILDNKIISSKTKIVHNALGLALEDLRELMPVPSEPFRYKLKATVSTRYSYEYYANIPIFASGKFIGYRYQRVPKIIPIYLFGECEVCVTDNTKPALWQYNAEENAGTKEIPGYALIYNSNGINKLHTNPTAYLKAATGEPLKNYNQGTKLTFYMADNNPFANYVSQNNIKPPVTKGNYDIYHYSPSDIYLKRLLVNFDNPDNRVAILHYDTKMGDVPKDLPDLKTSYSLSKPIPVTDETELKNAGLVPSSVISYSKYEITADKMAHFTKTIQQGIATYSPNLEYDYANNLESYKNRTFGIEWSESCHDATYNPLCVEEANLQDFKVGNIVIIDNDRPNIFVYGFQDRYPTDTFIVPTEVYNEKWFPSTLDNNSGPENWFIDDKTFGGSISQTCFTNIDNGDDISPQKFNPEAETIIFKEDKELLTDIPVRFEFTAFDNIGSITVDTFAIKKEDGTNDDLPKWEFNEFNISKKPFLQHIFRTPGKYYVELSTKDNALGWPLDVNRPKGGENGTALDENQSRVLRAYFEVIPSRFEYRILERNINGE